MNDYVYKGIIGFLVLSIILLNYLLYIENYSSKQYHNEKSQENRFSDYYKK